MGIVSWLNNSRWEKQHVPRTHFNYEAKLVENDVPPEP